VRQLVAICCFATALAGTAHAVETPAAKASSAPARTIAFKSDDDLTAPLARVVVGLVLALGVGAAALAGYKRFTATHGGTRRMRLIETLRLGPKATLFLVELDGRTLLIGQQGESLAQIERPRDAG